MGQPNSRPSSSRRQSRPDYQAVNGDAVGDQVYARTMAIIAAEARMAKKSGPSDATKAKFERNLQIVCQDENEKSWKQCPICQAGFRSQTSLNSHLSLEHSGQGRLAGRDEPKPPDSLPLTESDRPSRSGRAKQDLRSEKSKSPRRDECSNVPSLTTESKDSQGISGRRLEEFESVIDNPHAVVIQDYLVQLMGNNHQQGIAFLKKICANIVRFNDAPDSQKYRRIRLNNALVVQILTESPQILDILSAIGFSHCVEDGEEFIQFRENQSIESVQLALNTLSALYPDP